MKLFSQLFHDLDGLTKTNERLKRLAEYFKEADPVDSIWACWFLSGNRVKGAVKTRELREFVAVRTGYPDWVIEECYDRVGDLAETLSLLIGDNDSAQEPIHLHQAVSEHIKPLVYMDRQDRQDALSQTWNTFRSIDLLPFHKILTGGFRMGISKGNLCKALGMAGGIDPAIVAQRLAGSWTPDELSLQEILNPDETESRLCRPFPFCLAYPLQEESPGILGDPNDWQIEWKWDGIRAQLIKSEGKAMIWSRGDESIGDAFPEILEATKLLPDNVCLDGEILAWGHEGLRSFSRLQKRLGRKSPTASMLKREPVRFRAYDLLSLGGEDLRDLIMERRREKLERLISSLPNRFPVSISDVVEGNSWKDLKALREESRDRGVEGFMLKKKDSCYTPGRVKGTWYKWKIDPYLADMVVVSAQLGHGKRSNLYTDYTLAVRDEDGELVVVAKAYSGLTDKEIKEVDKIIRGSITGKFGPVRSVKPNLVFEIAFEGVQISKRHKSGVALRFPRINRWRRDKAPDQVDEVAIIKGYANDPTRQEEDGLKVDEDGNLLLF